MRHWVSERILTTLLALAGCILGGVAVENFRERLSFRVPDDGITWEVGPAGLTAEQIEPQGPGAKAGVDPGDVLLAIDEVKVSSPSQVTQRLYQIGAWRTARYELLQDGQVVETAVILQASSLNSAVYYFLWTVGLGYLGIGGVVLLRCRQRQMVGHFSLFCLASFVVYSFSYTGELDAFDRFVYWADVWATLFAPALFLHFCLIFPGARHVSRVRRGLAAAGYLPPVVLLAAHHLAAAGALESSLSLGELRFLLDRLSMGLLGVYFVLAAVLLNAAGSHAEDPVLKQQRRWLSAGTLWGVLPFVVFYVWPYVAGDPLTTSHGLAVLSLGLIPLAFAFAIVRHRLMDVDLILRRGAAYSLAAAGILAGFLGILFVLTGAAGFGAGQLGPALWLASVVAAALLFHPLRGWIQQTLDRRFHGERYDYRQTLVDFAAELSTETDRECMLSALADRLEKTLNVHRLAVFLRDDSAEANDGFRMVRARGIDNGHGTDLFTGNVFDFGFLKERAGRSNQNAPYFYFEKPGDAAGLSASQKQTLSQLDLNHYVPCRVHGQTLAFLALGRTQEGRYLSNEDLSLVRAVSGYFAIALENTRLYESLQRQVAEYERLKDYSQNIVESLSVGITAVDLEDRVETWNTQLELMFGISRQQAVGRRLSDLLPQELVAETGRVREEAGIHHIYEFRMKAGDFPTEFRPEALVNGGNGTASKQNDRERILNIAVTPLVTENFDRIGRLIIFDDVTERIELEEQLIQADKLSSIGLLAAGVAHEVNTPLAVISNYAQMMARQVEREAPQKAMLEKITSQTFRASEIVNSLLNFSRVASRELGNVNVNEVLHDTLRLLEPQLRKAQISIKTDLAPQAGTIRGNTSKLQQVFLNLFLNARDAMPEGGRLTVRNVLRESREGESFAHISVADTGPGIAPDHLKRIFDPFFTTKGPKRGTGLGLAVTYGIVQEHSGTIRVDSEPGRGTVFHVEIPLAGKPIHAQF